MPYYGTVMNAAQEDHAVVTIRMPQVLRDRLESEAKREERTVSQLVRLILSRKLDEIESTAACECNANEI